jgi:nitroimidazol reductase NimA-like FMN-containing flavoprotein (pyridoxamine 5'-phosphate oxidase superfamily)
VGPERGWLVADGSAHLRREVHRRKQEGVMAWSKAKQMKFLSDAEVIRVATVNRRGRPQVTPVCHVVWKEKIYWASDFDAVKLANLKRRPWVSLVADVYKNNWRKMGGVMVQGRAKVYRKGALFLAIRERLYKKYRVYKSNSGFEEGEAAIIEVLPKRRFDWWFK